MRTLFLVLILSLIGLQYKLWLGEGSIRQWQQLEHKTTAQTEENEKLLARNQAIEADITELKSGDQSLEEQARDELGMVLFETVRDVLKEDESEDDVLVLARIHVVAKLISGEPQLPLEANIGRGVLGGRRGGFLGTGHDEL